MCFSVVRKKFPPANYLVFLLYKFCDRAHVPFLNKSIQLSLILKHFEKVMHENPSKVIVTVLFHKSPDPTQWNTIQILNS